MTRITRIGFTALTTAVVLVSSTVLVVVLIVKFQFSSDQWCLSAAVDNTNSLQPEVSCSRQVDAEFERIGVGSLIDWIYWPLLLIFDLVALLILTANYALSWIREFENRRKFALYTSLLTLILLAVPQLLMNETVNLISTAVD